MRALIVLMVPVLFLAPAISTADCRGAVRAPGGALVMAGDSQARVYRAFGEPDHVRELVFRPAHARRHDRRKIPSYGIPVHDITGEQWVYRQTGINAKTVTVNLRGGFVLRVCQYLH